MSNETHTNPSGSVTLVLADAEGAPWPYFVSIEWSPVLSIRPNGDAWAFFTAQLNPADELGVFRELSTRKVFASKFDAALGAWQPGRAMYGEVAFGPTSDVDSLGRIHLVYSVRESLADSAFSTLVHMTVDDAGNWSQPQMIVSSETAGHQLSPDLTIDSDGGLHLAWQDQRGVSDELRAADPSNADVFVSDLNPDGTWSEPVQVNQRPDDATNASRPQLVADGDRLIAVWSVYNTEVGLDTATTLMWSERPIGDYAAWSEPQAIFDRGSDLIGGRFLDMADDPSGGVTLVYGRRTEVSNQLYLQRLDQDSVRWSEAAMIASGDRGSYPRIAVNNDGTTYVVYNLGSGVSVKVGALAIAAGQTVAGAEESLTAGEEGIQGIATVSVDPDGHPWVVYFHQPESGPVTEARVLSNAQI